MSTTRRAVRLYVDGGARGNPGPAAAGVVIRSADDGTVLFEGGFFLGEATSNVAEYRGLLAGLTRAAALASEEVEVYSDSQLLVRQMKGLYRVKSPRLVGLFAQANGLCRQFRGVRFTHVQREDNKDADRLVNQALNLGRNVEDAAEDD